MKKLSMKSKVMTGVLAGTCFTLLSAGAAFAAESASGETPVQDAIATIAIVEQSELDAAMVEGAEANLLIASAGGGVDSYAGSTGADDDGLVSIMVVGGPEPEEGMAAIMVVGGPEPEDGMAAITTVDDPNAPVVGTPGQIDPTDLPLQIDPVAEPVYADDAMEMMPISTPAGDGGSDSGESELATDVRTVFAPVGAESGQTSSSTKLWAWIAALAAAAAAAAVGVRRLVKVKK